MKPCRFIFCILLAYGCIAGNHKFGSNLQTISKHECDINGDGIADYLFILEATHKSSLCDDCIKQGLRGQNPSYNPQKQIVLGLQLSHMEANQKTYVKHVIHNSSFFSTPIWQQKPYPISIVKADDMGDVSDAIAPAGDLIALGTEAGIDIYLYWKNDSLQLYEPDEEP